MKQYFISLSYKMSGLSAMERAMLEFAKPFDNCLVDEVQLDALRDYFRKKQGSVHEANPRLNTVAIGNWMAGPEVFFIYIGQINLHAQEVKDLPQTFKDFLTKG